MKNKRIAAGVLACLMLVSAAGCGKDKEKTEEESVQGTAVEVQPVETGEMAAESAIAGTVTAKNAVQVFPLLAGNVTALNVEEGDMVTKGQVLFQIDTSTVTSTYASLQQAYSATKATTDQVIVSAQLGVQNAQIALDQATTAYENTKALHAAGAASDQQLTQAEQAVQQAQGAVTQAQASQQASLAQMQASMDQIQAQAKLGTVTAPVSGLVTTVGIQRGGMAAQAQPAVVIAEGGVTEVTVSVSETVLSGIQVGDVGRIDIQSEAAPVDGTIVTVGAAANPQTKLYDVTLSLPEGVKPPIGTFTTVTLYTDRRADAVYVPTEAILTDGDTQYVFITTEERPEKDEKKSDVGAGDGPWADKIEITTGLIGDGITEVTSGLTGGETLVVKGQSYLSDGSLVRVVSGEDDA